eukprot:8922247-Alexandrium_andersonii.AAC.1
MSQCVGNGKPAGGLQQSDGGSAAGRGVDSAVVDAASSGAGALRDAVAVPACCEGDILGKLLADSGSECDS